MLTDAAMATALAIVLGNLRFIELPQGGSISCAAIPIMALAMRRGISPAAAAGLCAGLVHALLGGVIVHPVQLLLDYGIGAMAPACAGLGRSRYLGPRSAIAIAAIIQLMCYVISGAIFFAATGTAAWAYSFVYNATIVVPEALLAMSVLPPVLRALDRAIPLGTTRSRRQLPTRPVISHHALHNHPPRPVVVHEVAVGTAPLRSHGRLDDRPPAFTSWRAHGA